MNTIKNIIVLILVLLTTALFAQSGNSDLNAKLMKMDGKYYVFLTDNQSNPYSNKDISVSGDATGAAFGESAFLLSGVKAGFTKLSLTLHQKDSKRNNYIYVTFGNKGTSETEYSCPMHADELLNKAGTCPKCGKALNAKSVNVYTPSSVVRKGAK